jgi:hypothetical protein
MHAEIFHNKTITYFNPNNSITHMYQMDAPINRLNMTKVQYIVGLLITF